MTTTESERIEREVRDLVSQSGFELSEKEWQGIILNDFGLGDFRKEGAAIIDILRTDILRTTILVLLPGQTLPEHKHPVTEDSPGKEETLRILYGSVITFETGDENTEGLAVTIPAGKEAYYTSRRATVLRKGDQHTLPPDEFHWFQAGPEGVVTIEFQNRVDEMKNIFSDPAGTGISIPESES
ncbi:MAG: D-lyxose/D-mannose family sugar isomerase [Verrucomicrobiota bacterium]